MVEGAAPPVKTAKQLEKEAKKAAEKAAKLEKLASKQSDVFRVKETYIAELVLSVSQVFYVTENKPF